MVLHLYYMTTIMQKMPYFPCTALHEPCMLDCILIYKIIAAIHKGYSIWDPESGAE